MNADELTKHFKLENKEWSLDGVIRWMVQKKQIPSHIAEHALKMTLLEMEDGLEIKTFDVFDNRVLGIARQFIKDDGERSIALLNKSLNEKINERLKDLNGRVERLEKKKSFLSRLFKG